MNHHQHFNYPLYNGFYQEAKPSFISYDQPYDAVAYVEEHREVPNEYTILPKSSSFFDSYVRNTLDVTRESTDNTENGDFIPYNQKHYAQNVVPFQGYQLQDMNPHAVNMNTKVGGQVPKTHFTAVIGASAGISFNILNNGLTAKFSQQDPSPLSSGLLSAKVEETSDKMQYGNDQSMNSEEDDENMEESLISNQLESLMESKVWGAEKDQLLLKLGSQYKCDWKKVAKRFNHKKITPHFLKIRYKELTCAPLQRRIKFTHREDLMIAKYFEKYGSNWAQMAVHFKDRTAIMLKNRYYSFIRKRNMLDALLVEAKEIEKDSCEVDNLRDQEAESYLDRMNTPKDDVNQQSFGNFAYETENPTSQMDEKIIQTSAYSSNDKHPIFGYERSFKPIPESAFTMGAVNPMKKEMKTLRFPCALTDTEKGHETKEQREIQILKGRVKSLQSLYMQTKMELNKMKSQTSGMKLI